MAKHDIEGVVGAPEEGVRHEVPTEAGSMFVELREGRLLIDMPLEKRPRSSHSDQHVMVVTTHGNVLTPLKIDGKNVTVNLNCFTVQD